MSIDQRSSLELPVEVKIFTDKEYMQYAIYKREYDYDDLSRFIEGMIKGDCCWALTLDNEVIFKIYKFNLFKYNYTTNKTKFSLFE